MACLAFVAIAVFFLASLELLFRVGVQRVSRIEQRVVREYKSVLESGRRPSSAKQVIILGNSLLESGLQFEVARNALLTCIDARRLVVENTNYHDWYFGLRGLFDEGSRPNAVVLVMTPRQFVGSTVRGPYFAYHLMRTADLPLVVKELKLSNTEASNLAFANASAFFGLSAEVRKWIAGVIFPDLPGLMNLATRPRYQPLIEELVYSTSLVRFQELLELTNQYHSRFILIVPPTDDGRVMAGGYSAIRRAGVAAGVSVLIPVHPDSLLPEHYSDSGLHLNVRGAEVFTRCFVESLRRELEANESADRSEIISAVGGALPR